MVRCLFLFIFLYYVRHYMLAFLQKCFIMIHKGFVIITCKERITHGFLVYH